MLKWQKLFKHLLQFYLVHSGYPSSYQNDDDEWWRWWRRDEDVDEDEKEHNLIIEIFSQEINGSAPKSRNGDWLFNTQLATNEL